MNRTALREKARIMDEAALGRALTRISHEILERNRGANGLVLLGIRSRGLPLAARIARKIEEIEGVAVPVEALDITAYRDDLAPPRTTRITPPSEHKFAVDGRHIVLVDDVIYTGRTVRAAIEALFDLGRPADVRLAVVVDRGQRELPIRPDFVGKNLPTAHGEVVQVRVNELDGEDSVVILAHEC